MTDAERGYLAGIIDGEGCLQAHTYSKLVLRLEVGNTDRALTDWLLDRFGGAVAESAGRGRKRTVYLWRAHPGVAVPLLREVLPLLIVKHRQAEAFIELATMRAAHPHGTRLSETARAARQALVDLIKADKRGGVASAA